MKILQLLEALEIPHAIFSTGRLDGMENYVTTHKDFKKMLKPLGFVVHKYEPSKYVSDYITRDLSRDEYSDFKALGGKYKMVQDDDNGLVHERVRRPLKEYLPKK